MYLGQPPKFLPEGKKRTRSKLRTCPHPSRNSPIFQLPQVSLACYWEQKKKAAKIKHKLVTKLFLLSSCNGPEFLAAACLSLKGWASSESLLKEVPHYERATAVTESAEGRKSDVHTNLSPFTHTSFQIALAHGAHIFTFSELALSITLQV